MAELKQFVFFDFEMLCSNRGMPFEEMEAIRLGAVKYDLETEEITSFDQYIRPINQKPLSTFCQKLTGINDEDLKTADNFQEVFTDFLTWVGGIKRSRFFSWSKSDIARMKMDAELHDIPLTTINKIENRYVDFQAIFTRRVTKNNFSVENALKLYGIQFIGDKHNPMYDAYNTLIIYLSFSRDRLKTDLIMLNQYILDEIPSTVTEINYELKQTFLLDLEVFKNEIRDVYKMKDGHSLLKRAQRLLKKYENVLLNRSGIFSKEMEGYVRQLNDFYKELLLSYEEHVSYTSRIMLLDEQTLNKVQKIAVTTRS